MDQKKILGLNKCPSCLSLVEKNSGCPHMTCPICLYDWCWTCGLSRYNIFHRIQSYKGETGFVCEIVNSVTQNLKCLPYPIALLIALILIFTAPIAAIIPLVLAGIPYVIIINLGFIHDLRHNRRKKWIRVLIGIFVFLSIAPAIALAAVAYTIFLGLFFSFIPLLTLIMLVRIPFYHCCKPKKSF